MSPPPPFRESISWIISPSKFWTATIFLHAHLQVVYYKCVKFHKNPISRLGGVVHTRYMPPPPPPPPPPFRESTSWIISPFKIWTATIFLHAHLQVVYYKCVKFHKNPISRLGGVALTRYMSPPPPFRESISWIISPSKFWTATIFLHAHLQVVYYKCVKFHKNPISRLGGVALTRYMSPPPPFRESTSWIISPFKIWTATIFLHAHLQVVYYKCVKFHKNPISRLGGVALTRYMPPPPPPPFVKVQVELSRLLKFGQQPYSFMHICR